MMLGEVPWGQCQFIIGHWLPRQSFPFFSPPPLPLPLRISCSFSPKPMFLSLLHHGSQFHFVFFVNFPSFLIPSKPALPIAATCLISGDPYSFFPPFSGEHSYSLPSWWPDCTFWPLETRHALKERPEVCGREHLRLHSQKYQGIDFSFLKS